MEEGVPVGELQELARSGSVILCFQSQLCFLLLFSSSLVIASGCGPSSHSGSAGDRPNPPTEAVRGANHQSPFPAGDSVGEYAKGTTARPADRGFSLQSAEMLSCARDFLQCPVLSKGGDLFHWLLPLKGKFGLCAES